MLQSKLHFLAVVLLSLMVLSHADKPKCADLADNFHPYQCRKTCPIVGPHYGHETEKYVDLVTDSGTCDEGLKCCRLYYYRSGGNVGRIYTDTGTSWPTKESQWCWWIIC